VCFEHIVHSVYGEISGMCVIGLYHSWSSEVGAMVRIMRGRYLGLRG
jgi:hypothetical protein